MYDRYWIPSRGETSDDARYPRYYAEDGEWEPITSAAPEKFAEQAIEADLVNVFDYSVPDVPIVVAGDGLDPVSVRVTSYHTYLMVFCKVDDTAPPVAL